MDARKILAVICLFLVSNFMFSQGATCADAEPFCAGNGLVFANTSDGTSAETGPDYGCLGSEPNPAWYFLQIDQPGDLSFEIAQNTQADFTGTGLDVDFIAWGPFTSADDYCNGMLVSANEVGCSYSAAPVENFTINNAQAGEIYVLLITNFNGSPGFISLTQTNNGNTGAGSTNCDILNQVNLCDGDTVTLDATDPTATTYAWQVDTGSGFVVIPGATNPTLTVPVDIDGDTVPDTFSGVYQAVIQGTSGTINNITTVTFSTVPVANQPPEIRICDGNNDGSETFDLTQQDATILGGQAAADYTITYHTSQTDADNDANPIANPAAHVSSVPQATIVVRIDNNNNNDCYDTTTFDIFVDPTPTATAPANPIIRMCDGNNDGSETFDLTQFETEVLGGQTNVTVTYHTSQADADNDANPIANPAAYVSSVPQATIVIRVDNNDNNSCYATTTFDIFVDVTPTATQPADIILCDTFNDNEEEFDLTQQDLTILNGQVLADVTLTYHLSQADADNDANPIPNPATYLSTNPTVVIYVRVDNNLNNDCYATTTFNIEFNASITATQPANPEIRICDAGADGTETFDLTQHAAEIINGQTDVNITYHNSQADADNDANPIATPAAYVSNVPQQTIYIRVDNINFNDCFSTTTFDIFVDTIPVAVQPAEIRICDTDNDVIEVFDLTQQDVTILGGLDPNLYTVNYYLSQNDADLDQNAIVNPAAYTSTVFVEDIFVRVENDANTTCYTTTSFQIFIDSIYSAATPPSDIVTCDDISNDGVEDFDISAQTPVIMGGLSNTLATVTYHLSQADADNDVNQIVNLNPYNTGTVTIYYRMENNNNTTCYTTGSFQLVVNQNPILAATNIDFDLCYDYTANGIAPFNLAEKDIEFTGGNVNYGVTYHLSANDAQNDANALPIPYTNVTNPQVIHVRVEDINTGCFTLTTMTLRVLDALDGVTPPVQTFCDDDNDGFGEFQLNQDLINIITGNVPAGEVTFHETLAEAEAIPPVNAITGGVYTNIDPYTQTIYANVSLPTSDCYDIVAIQLQVIDSPILPSDEPYEVNLCDVNDTDPNDGIMQYDLTSLNGQLLAGATPPVTDYTLTYFEGLDANGNPDPATQIANPAAFTNTTPFQQTIYVEALSTVTGCSSVKAITLIISAPPVIINQAYEYKLCDDDYYTANDPNHPQIGFDLLSITDQISTQSNVSFAFFQLDQNTNAVLAPILTPQHYVNILANPEAVQVQVTDDITGCVSTSLVILEVLNNPSPMTSQQIVNNFGVMTSCLNDPAHTNDAPLGTLEEGYARFDLTTNEAAILNGEPVVATYYTSDGDAILEQNPIQNPATFYNTTPYTQTIYMRVTNENPDSRRCYTIVEFQIHVPVPEVSVTVDGKLCVDEQGVPLPGIALPVLTATATNIEAPDNPAGTNTTSMYSFQWFLNDVAIPGATSSTLIATQAGTYSVTASGPIDMACQRSVTANVTVSAGPGTFDADVTTNAFANPHQIIANATSSIPGVTFEYSLDNINFQSSGTFDDVAPGAHTVYIRDIAGCATESVDVVVVHYPQFFTPNGDGINDTWNIIGIGEIPISQIYIFDRFGKLIKQIDPDGAGWDGRYNGHDMPATDYWFKIIYIEGTTNPSQKEFKAHFTLKR